MNHYVYLNGIYWIVAKKNYPTILEQMKIEKVSTAPILLKTKDSDNYDVYIPNGELIINKSENLVIITP